jgi:hypothetical protein
MKRVRPYPGHKIAASDDPLSQYGISDIDSGGGTEYYGYVDKDGNWCIMEVTATTVRYAVGSSDYITNWTGRAALEYGYFDGVF